MLNDEAWVRAALKFSDRHRLWGFNCPATDVDSMDSVWVEYDFCEVKVVAEYKHVWVSKLTGANLDALKNFVNGHVCERCGELAGERAPLFVVGYCPDCWSMTVAPMNDKAAVWLDRQVTMSEPAWVELLYRMRGREMPTELKAKLNSEPCGSCLQSHSQFHSTARKSA